MVESEVARLLAEPAKEIGAIMLKHLERKKKERPYKYLKSWLEERIPIVMGVVSCIFMALRFAVNQGDKKAIEFIHQYFRDGYLSLLSANKFGGSLNNIKNNFRNPVCHGIKTYGPREYQAFVRLAVGTTSMRKWDRWGPENVPSILENAFFHNHLTLSKSLPILHIKDYPKERPARLELLTMFQKLMNKASSETECHIEVQPCETAREAKRDMAFYDVPFSNDFKLNSRINIGYYYKGLQAPVDITIFDVGTTGKLVVFMPNDELLEARISWFPDVHRNQTIILTGARGLETVFAIATQKNLDLREKLLLNSKKIAQVFIGQDSKKLLYQLSSIIKNFPEHSWAIGEFEFNIIA
jgi:hypothetical protein